jgi:hypothetical protein
MGVRFGRLLTLTTWRLASFALDTSLAASIPRHPPRNNNHHHTSQLHPHRRPKAHPVLWRIFTLKQPRANRTPNLAIRVHESNREGRSSCVLCGLDSPRPHERIPRLRDGLRDAGRGIDAACVGEGVEDAVAGYNDDGEEERVDGAGETCGVGPDAEDGDYEDGEECHWDVEELRFG